MGSIYYYTFYLLGKLSQGIRKDDKDFAFTALMLLSTPIFLNLLSLVILFGGVGYHESKQKIWLWSILLVLPVVWANYYLLMSNKKNEEIIAQFDEKYKDSKHNVLAILLVIFYFIFSIASCIYLANQNRSSNHRADLSVLQNT